MNAALSSDEKPVLLVTGASSGIGDGIARRFAAGGYRLVAIARRKERLERLAQELSRSTDIVVLALDVTAADAPERAVELAMAIGTALRKTPSVNTHSPQLPPQAIIRDRDTYFDEFHHMGPRDLARGAGH